MTVVLKVPFALDSAERLVHVNESLPGQPFRCPNCLGRVARRGGSDSLVRHYYHVGTAPCCPETLIHKTAKFLIAQTVSRWKSGGPVPIAVHRCSTPHCVGITEGPLPDWIDGARVEAWIDRWKVDVALLRVGSPAAVVEVVYSHPADPEKIVSIAGMKLPFIEVNAVEILEDPLRWVARKLKQCSACDAEEKALEQRRLDYEREQAEMILRKEVERQKAADAAWEALEAATQPPRTPRTAYQAKLWPCSGCRREAPVFNWTHRFRKGNRAVPPRRPFPATLRFTNVRRPWGPQEEWADTCVYCGTVIHPWATWESEANGAAGRGRTRRRAWGYGR